MQHMLLRDAQRVARAAVFNGVPIPAIASATLEANGVNVGDLEQRLRQNFEFSETSGLHFSKGAIG